MINDFHERVIPKILMVSTKAFGVLAAISPNCALPYAIAELTCNSLELKQLFSESSEQNQSLTNELVSATHNAIEMARIKLKSTKEYSRDQLKILNELANEEVLPQNIQALVMSTVAFQEQYCTSKDAENVINVFNTCFHVELAKNRVLSQYYTLAAEFFTIEKIQIINALLGDNTEVLKQTAEILHNQTETIAGIERTSNSINRKLDFLLDKVSWLLNELTCVMLAVFVFLFTGIVHKVQYDLTLVFVAFLSYCISNIVAASLGRENYICQLSPNIKKGREGLDFIGRSISMCIRTFLPLVCYVLLSYGIQVVGPADSEFKIVAISIISGGMVTPLFKCQKLISNIIR